MEKKNFLLEDDLGVSIFDVLQNLTPKNGDNEVGFGAKQVKSGDWGFKSFERQDQMGKEGADVLDDKTLIIADPGDIMENAIFLLPVLLLPTVKDEGHLVYTQLSNAVRN